jgi:2-dehydropantoate 2-reductase
MATVAVIGAGAVGCYYGARLARAGNDVRFLMRRDLAAVRDRGLDVRSVEGDFRLERPSVFAASTEIGPVDWVLCCLKTTSLHQAKDLIAPCARPGTRIVALMNGLGVEEQLAQWFGPERIFGTMAFVCINRGEPGVVHHLRYGRLSVAHVRGDAHETAELAGLFEGAGLDVVSYGSLLAARWEKLCWNVPFNGLSVAAGGIGTAAIVADPALRATAERAMREVVAVANADLQANRESARLDAGEIVARMFALTDTMGDYHTSMVLDYAEGRPLEADSILGEPCRRAKRLGVEAPTMEALYAIVSGADRSRRGLLPRVGGGER